MQSTSLPGRLEVLGPGTATAVGRRQYAAQLDRQWRKEEKAAELATRQDGAPTEEDSLCYKL